MRIVVDTNIFISGTFWYGLSNQILKLVEEGKIKLIISEEIYEEYERVLKYEEIQEKIKIKNLEMKYTLEKIINISESVRPIEKINVITEDKDDNKFLEAAVAANANFIVSNDKHLLKLEIFRGIKILTPEEFLKEFKDE